MNLNTELFSIEVDDDRFFVYSPLQRAAFEANAAFMSALAASDEAALGADVLAFLREIGIVERPIDVPPITEFSGEPKPTSVTLFLTMCQLRCALLLRLGGRQAGARDGYRGGGARDRFRDSERH